MKILVGLHILTVFSLGNGEKIEAIDGENVTLFFPVEEGEKVDLVVRVFFKADGLKEELIAKYSCLRDTCDCVEKAGVSLRVEGNVTLTLHQVNRSTNTGVYEAEIFNGKSATTRTITLVVKDPPPALTSFPEPISSPKPPDPHGRQRLYVLIPLGLFVIVLIFVGILCLLNNYRKDPKTIAVVEAEIP